MTVKQFFDDGLAHASYAVVSDGKMAVIDPGRDPKPYEEFANDHDAHISAVFETHPHADFVSCHLELHKEHGADIYVHPEMKVDYPHQGLDHEEEVRVGQVSFQALFTPGHSPDHNSYLLKDEEGNPHSVFTGDSLFIGDVGRPDLRENAGNVQAARKELAGMMYDTVHDIFKGLPDQVMVYPAHGKGSLCGKNMSTDTYSTIGKEKERNWALRTEDKEQFLSELLEGQPYIPKYFPYDVSVNASGVKDLEESVRSVRRLGNDASFDPGTIIVDVRPQEEFEKGHIPGSWNIPDGDKFETWLGSLIAPDEKFYLVAEDDHTLDVVIRKSAKIGYEQLIEGGAVPGPDRLTASCDELELDRLKQDPSHFTILDVRNGSEVQEKKPFADSINIPLPELRDRIGEIPSDKPLVVHCAGGYRSAIASSMIARERDDLKVEDLGFAIEEFKPEKAKA
jgi:hydroxyacylglutathione hydrolase